MYQVARSVNEINIVHLHGFEANSPYAKRFMTEARKKRILPSVNLKGWP